MSAKNITDYRNSFSLVPNNLHNCKARGQTFRGPIASVQVNYDSYSTACSGRLVEGTAKPGPTTDTSSRIARLKKLQKRTREILEHRVREALIEALRYKCSRMILLVTTLNQEELNYLVITRLPTNMEPDKHLELVVHPAMSYTLRMSLRDFLSILQLMAIIKFSFLIL